MIKKIFPFVFLAFLACDPCPPEPNEFQFDYKILRNSIVNNEFDENRIYYYNADNQLLRVDRIIISPDNTPLENFVEYKDNFIEYWDSSKYFFDSNGLITSINTSSGGLINMEYESNNIIYKKSSTNNIINRENFYTYKNGNMVKDSTILYQEDYEPSIDVYKYVYTDSLIKDFMRDFSGLYEMPTRSKNLPRQGESSQGITKYSYEILENELIQYKDFYDIDNTIFFTTMTTYKLDEE